MFTNDIVGASKSDQGVEDPNSIRLFAQGIPETETLAQIALPDVRTILVVPSTESSAEARSIGEGGHACRRTWDDPGS